MRSAKTDLQRKSYFFCRMGLTCCLSYVYRNLWFYGSLGIYFFLTSVINMVYTSSSVNPSKVKIRLMVCANACVMVAFSSSFPVTRGWFMSNIFWANSTNAFVFCSRFLPGSCFLMRLLVSSPRVWGQRRAMELFSDRTSASSS